MSFAIWQSILEQQWGLKAKLSLLDGEFDLNILVKSADNNDYVLKVMRSGCLQGFIDMQIKALNHIKVLEPELPFPEVVTTLLGQQFVECTDEFGKVRLLWLIRKLPGRKYVDHGHKSLNLIRQLGGMIARFGVALKSFEHNFLIRDLKWNLSEANWVEEHVNSTESSTRKKILKNIIKDYKDILPILKKQPFQPIHGDVNDHNTLVNACLKTKSSISGIVDLGDMCFAPRVCDVAIAGAYIVLDHEKPEAALATLIEGYNFILPFNTQELDLIWPLLRMRLAVSVINSTLMSKDDPNDPYITISQAPAWRFLESKNKHSKFIAARLRSICGQPVVDGADRVLKYLDEQRGSFASIFACDLTSLPMGSLSVETSRWPQNPFYLPPEEALRVGEEVEHKNNFWIGYYNEPRLIYVEPAFRNGPWKASDRRTVHLAVDIFAPTNTQVYSPLAGRVAVAENRIGYLDYGGVIILEHKTPDGDIFYTLYGHLDPEFMSRIKVGDTIDAGVFFAHLGDEKMNGGWAPHLHFQLALMTEGIEADWPGVGDPDEMYFWNSVCPNPAALLNLPDKMTHYSPTSKKDILNDRLKHFGSNLSITYDEPVMLARGWKHHIFDEWGRPYLDAYNNVPHVGHAHPRIQKIVANQMGKINSNTRYLHPSQTAFAKKILSKLPPNLDICFFVNSGSEANELALRLVRAHTGSKGIVTLDHGYHGNTTGAVDISAYKFNATGGVGQPDWVELIELPDDYRGRFKRHDLKRAEKFGDLINPAIANLMSKRHGLAGFIAETFPSVAGQIIPPDGYLKNIYKHIRTAGGLCVADEVQTGLGRLGEYYFGFEQQRVEPDIVVLGKPIGNGHPIGVVITTKKIAESFAQGPEFFSTFGGSTLSCLIGKEVLEIIDEENLQNNAKLMGKKLLNGLKEIQNNFSQIGDVRGMGLFCGVDLVKNIDTREEDSDLCRYIKNRMRDNRILMGSDGAKDNVLKIRPPLTIDEEGIDMILSCLQKIMKEI